MKSTPQTNRTPFNRAEFLANFSKGCPVIICEDAADMARKSHRPQPSVSALLTAIDRADERYHDRKDA